MKKILINFILLLFLLLSCKKSENIETSLENKKDNEIKKDIKKEVVDGKDVNKCIIKMFEGNVNIFDERGQRVNPEAGLSLKINWAVETKDNSMVELEVGKLQTVIIKENSFITINKLFLDKDKENTSIKINNGTIFTSSKKLTEGSSFEVQTKSITVGIRGTDFAVSDEEGKSKVLVEEGEVRVKKNIESKELEEIKKKDEKLYKELKEELEEETIVKKDEKLEVTEKELEEESKEISKSLANIKGRLNKGEKITSEDKDLQNIKNRKRVYRRNRIDKEDKERYLNRKSPYAKKVKRDEKKEGLKEKVKEKRENVNEKKENNKEKKEKKDDIKNMPENKKESNSNTSVTIDGKILLKTIEFSDSFLIDEVEVANEKFSKIAFETEANDIIFNRVRVIYSNKKDVVFSKNFSISKDNNSEGILVIDNSKEVVKIRVTLTSKMNKSPQTKVFVYGIK